MNLIRFLKIKVFSIKAVIMILKQQRSCMQFAFVILMDSSPDFSIGQINQFHEHFYSCLVHLATMCFSVLVCDFFFFFEFERWHF